jgi:hypothetical protein
VYVYKYLYVLIEIMSVKISKAVLQRGMKVEQAEHPWATRMQVRRIATDHIAEHPNAYPPKKRK